jgi:ATP-dependent DNA ligase
MMRAERLSSGAEIVEKLGKCSIEPKYDGLRLQVHVKKAPSAKLQAPSSKLLTSPAFKKAKTDKAPIKSSATKVSRGILLSQ